MIESPFFASPQLQQGMPSPAVTDIASQVVPFVHGLSEILVRYKLLGLAAPQVGIDAAFFIVAEEGKIRVVINPQFERASFTKSKRNENGLDPAKSTEIARPIFIWCRYLDETGKEHSMQLIRGRARVWLHLSEYLTGTSPFAADTAPTPMQPKETA